MKVAFVAPFFGAKAAGGAEAECRHTAIRLAASGVDVEVLTTCVRDLHHDWNADNYPPGSTQEDGLTVRRFPTIRVDLAPFGMLNERLVRGCLLSREEEKRFMALHVNSADLYRYLAAHQDEYDWVCFIPYLFGTTYHGSRICPGKAVLIPCLHDEGYAKMRLTREMFRRMARIVFHSGAELELARNLYGDVPGRCILLGEGITTKFESDGARFRRKYGIGGKFLLYAGRKHETKNIPLLVRYFSDYKRRTGNDVKLVMIGPDSVPVEDDAKNWIVDLGFVPDQDKKDACSAATLFCQPSLNESFSIVIMESWVCGRPCLVHGNCAVTKEHVVKSGGGLFFTSQAEFSACVDRILSDPELAGKMGEAGGRYVRANFEWDRIIARFKDEVFAQ